MTHTTAAPKPPEQRRNRTPPHRGEWIELEPLEAPVLGAASGGWPANGRRAWRAWRQDPATTQWGPAEVFAARELCRLYDKLPFAEQRLRMDGLGLTPKGRRDLRWRTQLEARQQREAVEKAAQVRRLRIVAEKET